jgi:hypothetical protein
MLHTRTGDFTQDVPESSNAGARATTNELHNDARGTLPPPLSPPPPVSLEQLLAMQNDLMRVLMENLVQHEMWPPLCHQGWRFTTPTSWRGTLRRLMRRLI